MKAIKTFEPTLDPIIIHQEVSLAQAIKTSGKVILPLPGGYQCCQYDDILYLKSESNYTIVVFKDRSRRILAKTLGAVEEGLPQHMFFRVHRSFLVNAAHITMVSFASDDSKLVLSNDIEIPISRDKKALIKESFGE
jgi:two-component system LytT family response regulator